VLSLGSTFAPISNWLLDAPGSGTLAERTLGVSSDRTLPEFSRTTFRDWMADRGGSRVPADADRKALVLADPYTDYSHPDVGKATVRALEAAGVHVSVPDDVTDSGRPAFSKSMLDHARDTARANVAALAPRIRDGWDVVCVEPSDAVMYQHDYRDLLDGAAVDAVAENTYGVCEYLDSFRLLERVEFGATERSLAYHGHCHQKATTKDHHAVGVLRRAGYTVDPLDSSCCGMAGSFGYEAEHYSMSEAIAGLLVDQIASSPAGQVVAPGASCRAQLEDFGAESDPPHPIELVAAALR